jgi:hypothetical protein
LRHQSHPFGEYPPKDLECAHCHPPTIDLAKYSTAVTGGIDQNQITQRCDPNFFSQPALRDAIDESGSAMLNCNAAWPRFDLDQFLAGFVS